MTSRAEENPLYALTDEDFEKLSQLERYDGLDFLTAVKILGLNPSTDFRFSDISGIDLSGVDVSGFDFTGADTSGCGLKTVQKGDEPELDQIYKVFLHSASAALIIVCRDGTTYKQDFPDSASYSRVINGRKDCRLESCELVDDDNLFFSFSNSNFLIANPNKDFRGSGVRSLNGELLCSVLVGDEIFVAYRDHPKNLRLGKVRLKGKDEFSNIPNSDIELGVFDALGRYLVSIDSSGELATRNLKLGSVVTKTQVENGVVSVVINKDTVGLLDKRGDLTLYSLVNLTREKSLDVKGRQLISVFLDDKILVTLSRLNHIAAVDVRDARQLWQRTYDKAVLSLHRSGNEFFVFFRDGSHDIVRMLWDDNASVSE
jgi:hypothetical protein